MLYGIVALLLFSRTVRIYGGPISRSGALESDDSRSLSACVWFDSNTWRRQDVYVCVMRVTRHISERYLVECAECVSSASTTTTAQTIYYLGTHSSCDVRVWRTASKGFACDDNWTLVVFQSAFVPVVWTRFLRAPRTAFDATKAFYTRSPISRMSALEILYRNTCVFEFPLHCSLLMHF